MGSIYSKATGLVLLVIVGVAGCKKDADPSPYEVNSKLLAGTKGQSKSWKLVVASEQVEDAEIVTTPIDPCVLDNIYTFTNNDQQSYVATEGETKCLDSDQDLVESGYWTFTTDGKVAVILADHILPSSPGSLFSFYGYGLPSEVLELKETTFKIRMTYVKQQGVATLTRHYYFNFVKV